MATFFGDARFYVATHYVNADRSVLMCPVAMPKTDFGPTDSAFAELQRRKRRPLPLSRAVPGGEAMRSAAGRAAAAQARDVPVFVLDETDSNETFFYCFVPKGCVRNQPAEMFDVGGGLHLQGHVGYVPARCLSWKPTDGARLVYATFAETTIKDTPLRIRGSGEATPKFVFRPTMVATESGLILQ